MPFSWKQHFRCINCCFLLLFHYSYYYYEERTLIWCTKALSRALRLQGQGSHGTVWQQGMAGSGGDSKARSRKWWRCCKILLHLTLPPCYPISAKLFEMQQCCSPWLMWHKPEEQNSICKIQSSGQCCCHTRMQGNICQAPYTGWLNKLLTIGPSMSQLSGRKVALNYPRVMLSHPSTAQQCQHLPSATHSSCLPTPFTPAWTVEVNLGNQKTPSRLYFTGEMKTRPDLHSEALLAQHMFVVQVSSTPTLQVFVMIFPAVAPGAENQRNSHIVLRVPQIQSKISLCNPGILPSNSSWNMGIDRYKQPRQHEARLRILKWIHETGAAGTADFSNTQS